MSACDEFSNCASATSNKVWVQPEPPPTPTVSISAITTSVTEGGSITFKLTASSAPGSNLSVNVDVAQSGSFLTGTIPTSVSIASGQTNAHFSVNTYDDGVDEPNGSITATVESGTGYGVGSPSTKVVTVLDNDLPKLATPTMLDVEPLALRKAKLKWAAVANADKYVVEIRKVGKTSWTSQPATTQAYYEIDLDDILGGDGLADAPYAYEFHVKATKSGSSHNDSAFSDFIAKRDNPLLTGGRAYASSGGGQASLEWTTDASATSYQIRYRQLGDYSAFLRRSADHTSLGWPSGRTWPYYHPAETEDSNAPGNETISGLNDGELYAFQINYETRFEISETETVEYKTYSARDAYVWASGELPTRTSLVGTYPFFGYWEGGRYDYTICSATFTPNDGSWQNLIVHAFEQWERAVPHRLTVTRVAGGCISYGQPIDNDVPITLIRALFNESNEVYMVNTEGWHLSDWEVVLLQNGLFYCITGESPACVISTRYTESSAYWWFHPSVRELDPGSVDVLVNIDRASETHAIPGQDVVPSENDIRFNSCLPKPNRSGPDEGFSNYTLMVHEAGHALGLSNFSWRNPIGSSVAHPSIPNSVMSYDSEVYQITDEPDCSPHPFESWPSRRCIRRWFHEEMPS